MMLYRHIICAISIFKFIGIECYKSFAKTATKRQELAQIVLNPYELIVKTKPRTLCSARLKHKQSSWKPQNSPAYPAFQ